jgi:hypothetical protein
MAGPLTLERAGEGRYGFLFNPSSNFLPSGTRKGAAARRGLGKENGDG